MCVCVCVRVHVYWHSMYRYDVNPDGCAGESAVHDFANFHFDLTFSIPYSIQTGPLVMFMLC